MAPTSWIMLIFLSTGQTIWQPTALPRCQMVMKEIEADRPVWATVPEGDRNVRVTAVTCLPRGDAERMGIVPHTEEM